MRTLFYLLGAILIIFWLIGFLLDLVGTLIHVALVLGIIFFVVAMLRRKDKTSG